MSDKKYLSCAETAKLLRKALAKEFPGIKFYVRSHTYSGGASIDVDWQDGPSEEQVNPVIRAYEGADFDGMVDLKTYNSHWLLPDGSVVLAYAEGAYSYGEKRNPQPHPDAIRVSFGADFIHGSRACSKELVEQVAEKVHGETGWDVPEIRVGDWWVGGKTRDGQNCAFSDLEHRMIPGGTWRLDDYYNRELRAYSDYTQPEDAPKAKPLEVEPGPNAKELKVSRRETPEDVRLEVDRDWLWITFPAKPTEQVRDRLKALGGRWSRKRQAWYFTSTLVLEHVEAVIAEAGEALYV